MTTISTDLYTDITFTLSKCEHYKTIFNLLTSNTHVNHVAYNVVIQQRNAEKQRPPDTIDTDNGAKTWLKNDTPHRVWDLPAVIYADGTNLWYRNGLPHRDGDKPAYIGSDGSMEWWENGQQHRNRDLPAILHDNGTAEWYQHGNHHRDGGKPAVIYADGSKFWFTNNVLYTPQKLN